MCICPGRQSKPGTPNMFAEYRDDGPGGDPGNCVRCGLHWSKHRVEVVSHAQASHIQDAARKLPPGPAFIPAEHLNSRVTLDEAAAIIGDGYIWHAATDYTGAGWVRPRGSV